MVLLRLLAPIFDRLGIDQRTPPRIPVVPMAAVGLVELVAGILIARTYPIDHSMAGMPDMAAMPGMAASHHGTPIGEILAALALGAAVLLLGQRSAQSNRFWVRIGQVFGAGGIGLALLPQAATSHLILMLVIEVTLVIAPLAIIGFMPNSRPTQDLWAPIRGLLAAATAAGVGFVLITLHLPATQHWYHRSDRVAWWTAPLLLTIGLLFWSSALRFRLPSRWRLLLIALVFETGALIGLILLLAPGPLMEMGQDLPISALTDQRLAGALMMIVDLVVLARVLPHDFRRVGPWIPTSPNPSAARADGAH